MKLFPLALTMTLLAASADAQRALTKADIDRWMTELSNWGRWGTDDQLGTINLITPARRREAAALVRDGISVSLARDVEKEKAGDNPSPFGHVMTATGARGVEDGFNMDTYTVSYHGLAHTHMDSLAHMFHQGKMFNGFSPREVTRAGAGKLAVTNYKNGIFTRGILMDIPRLKGVAYLEPGQAIYPEDLEAWEKKAGVRVRSGDVVFVRTGRWARRAAKGAWSSAQGFAGLYASCAKWLRDRDAAMLGSDAASDVLPSGVEGVTQPIHQLVLISIGMPIFDNCDLEALSDAANRRRRWEFLITAAPLAVGGGTGSPLNPVATF
ncbi:MAG TPA: cyclase family protein [Terriglobales bacterium]|nr:cyclase family protein [Terriglobales bacterium]